MSSIDPILARVGAPGPGLLAAAVLLEQVQRLLGPDPRHRGLIPLLQCFERQGLAHLASSWVSTGRNLPISPAQMTRALGLDLVRQLARGAGLAADPTSAALCVLLPAVIDGLTPAGVVALGPDRRPAFSDTNVTAR